MELQEAGDRALVSATQTELQGTVSLGFLDSKGLESANAAQIILRKEFY
jgi:hypothetical protein